MEGEDVFTFEAVRADGRVGTLRMSVEGEVVRVSFVPLEAPMPPAGARYQIAGGVYEDLPWSHGHNFKRAQQLEEQEAALPIGTPASVRAAYAAEVASALEQACLNRIQAPSPRMQSQDAQVAAALSRLQEAGWVRRSDIASRREKPEARVYDDMSVQAILMAAESLRWSGGEQ